MGEETIPSNMRMLKAEALVLEKLTSNPTIKELAKQYHMSTSSVSAHLKLAERSGLIEKLEGQILERLVPPALACYEDQVLRGNLEAARDILYGMGIFRKAPKDLADGLESIEAYRMIRKQREEFPPREGEINAPEHE